MTNMLRGGPVSAPGESTPSTPTADDVGRALVEIEARYPAAVQPILSANRGRFTFEVLQVLGACPGRGRLLDLGCGLSPFPVLCARFGFRVTAIDDYRDPVHTPETLAVLDVFREYGVEVLSGDLFESGYRCAEANELAAVTSFDSMEHWHQSPKRLFHHLAEALRPGGVFFLGVPNCVNARKRITVPLGRGKWSQMTDWYEQETFRGHVREPDTDDLKYIARDLGFDQYRILGRNWLGYRSPRPMIRLITPWVDRLLRLNPSLCSDIYLLAWKDQPQEGADGYAMQTSPHEEKP